MTVTTRVVRRTLARLADRHDAPTYARRLHGYGRVTPYDAAEVRTIAARARRVAAWHDAATPDHHRDGVTWYARARDAAHHAADTLGVPRPAAVAAIATASPGLAWSRNVDALAAVVAVAGGAPAHIVLTEYRVPRRSGAVAAFRRAAVAYRDALASGDAVAATAAAHRDAPKVIGFAAGITTGGDTLAVAVDGHATLAADRAATIAERVGIGAAVPARGRAYDTLAAAYAVAAVARDLTPPMMQAVTWCAWRALPVAR